MEENEARQSKNSQLPRSHKEPGLQPEGCLHAGPGNRGEGVYSWFTGTQSRPSNVSFSMFGFALRRTKYTNIYVPSLFAR